MRPLPAGLAALLAAALAACQVPAGAPGALPGAGPATPTPRPAASTTVSVADLTGTWVFGSRGEPAPGAQATCAPDQVLTLAQEGERLLGAVSTRSGIVRQLEDLEGENVRGQVTLAGTYRGNLSDEGAEVAYALSFDAASGHLRGTRLGEPFWAAPWQDPGVAECGARPAGSPPPAR